MKRFRYIPNILTGTTATAIVLAIMCSCFNMAQARTLSESEARQVAQSFFAREHIAVKGDLAPVQRGARRAPSLTTAATYYVYNAGTAGDGYVIVSGDDRVIPVLGYSDSGYFDPTDVPENMQSWLDEYAEQIEQLDKMGINKPYHAAAPQYITGSAISPLIKSQWAQGSPFNANMPMLTSSLRAVTGCVATAMAQVMYFFKSPAKATQSIPAYTSKTRSISRPALSPVTFQWSSMKNYYSSSETSSAVATLLNYCAQSVEMDFQIDNNGNATSSANSYVAASAFANYFGYGACRHYTRSSYTRNEWETLVYNELKAGRPVYYHGQKLKGGHAFICDGFDGKGMFHINWGWRGSSDGFFALNILNPEEQGTGGIVGSDGYGNSQGMIINFKPSTTNTVSYQLSISDTRVYGASTLTRSSSSGNFSNINITGTFSNETNNTMSPDFGWGLYQNGELVKVVFNSYTTDIKPSYYISRKEYSLSFGSGLSNGTYELHAIYRKHGSNDAWQKCEGASRNYYKVTINSLTLTITGMGNAANPAYTVNTVTYSGTLTPNSNVAVNAHITNGGYNDYNMLYLFVNNVQSSMVMLDIPAYNAETVTLHFTPTSAGVYSIKLSLNSDGSSPLYTGSVTIKAADDNVNLSFGTPQVQNISGSQLTTNVFSVKQTITNKGTSAYSGGFVMDVYQSGVSSVYKTTTIGTTVNAGGSATINPTVTGLATGKSYYAKIYYYKNGTKTLATTTSTYSLPAASSVDMTFGSVSVQNASGSTINGTTFGVSFSATNKGSAAYTSGFVLDIYRSGYSSVYKTSNISTQVAAGKTVTITGNVTGLTSGQAYYGIVSYYKNGVKTQIAKTATYTMKSGSSTYIQGDVNGDGRVDVEDVNLLINFILKVQTPTASQISRCDMDYNYKLDVEDVNKIINIILGIK